MTWLIKIYIVGRAYDADADLVYASKPIAIRSDDDLIGSNADFRLKSRVGVDSSNASTYFSFVLSRVGSTVRLTIITNNNDDTNCPFTIIRWVAKISIVEVGIERMPPP